MGTTRMNHGSSVAVIGVGNMGAGIATNLVRRGWTVHVFDIDQERRESLRQIGALPHDSAAAASAEAHATIMCVVNAEQTHDVLFGVGAAANAVRVGHTVLLCPTMEPAQVQAVADRLWPMGLFCIDAPMSGGPARALDGSMSLMVACADNVYVRHERLLQDMSSRLFRISERIGDGARTKLVNNLAAAINLAGAAEVLAMAAHMGLDLGRTLEVIEQSSGQSWIGSDRMRRALAADFAPRAHMTLLEKDTRMAVQAARHAGFDGPLGARVRDLFADASAGGFAQHDDAALLQWLQRSP